MRPRAVGRRIASVSVPLSQTMQRDWGSDIDRHWCRKEVMRWSKVPILLLVLTVFGLSACGAGAGKSDCPTPAGGQALLKDEEHGYCLLYPAGLEVFNPNENETRAIASKL
jgi:hypothetical protein